jgi:transposase
MGVQSLRGWVKQREVDEGLKAGTTSADAARIAALEQENRELRRANAVLKSAADSMWTPRLCGTGSAAVGR